MPDCQPRNLILWCGEDHLRAHLSSLSLQLSVYFWRLQAADCLSLCLKTAKVINNQQCRISLDHYANKPTVQFLIRQVCIERLKVSRSMWSFVESICITTRQQACSVATQGQTRITLFYDAVLMLLTMMLMTLAAAMWKTLCQILRSRLLAKVLLCAISLDWTLFLVLFCLGCSLMRLNKRTV